MTPTTIERFFTWLLIGSALIPSVLFADDDFAAQLKEIRKSLDLIDKGLKDLGQPTSAAPIPPPSEPILTPVVPDVSAPPVEPVVPEPILPAKVPEVAKPREEPTYPLPEDQEVKEQDVPETAPLFPRNYFIPFLAVSFPADGDWTSRVGGGTYNLDEKNGFTAGARIGREFDWGLLEVELKGFRNTYESLDIGSGLPAFEARGKALGCSMLGTAGGRLALTDQSSLFAGFGLGLAYLSSQVEVLGNPAEDSGTAFAYQCFLGFEHAFSEKMETFIRYKFFGTTDLDYFSGRSLHELEAGLGILF
jgi:opacity protein-like surface antigen